MNKALKRRKLGQIAEFRNGLNFGKASHGQGCLLIGIPDFADRFTPDLKSLGTINPEGISGAEDYLKKGDIVFVRSNGNKALVGRSLYIDKDIEALYSGFCIRARFVTDEIDPKFCAYYTRTQTFRNQISGSAGTNINNLNQGILADVEVPIFPRETQQKIVSVLETLDAKIELTNQINAELEGMAKLLYDYWFVQFDFPMTSAQAASLGRPDLTGKPYKSSGGMMVHNPALNRQIPQGWTADTFDKLGEVVGGTTPSKEREEYYCSNGIPWITPKDLSNNKEKKFIERGEIDLTEAGQKSGSLKLMPAGTVLLSSRAPIGYTAIAINPLTTNQGFKSFVPNRGYGPDFIYQTLNHHMKLIEQNASGSTFKEISGGTLKAIRIPMPSPSLAQLYSDKIASMSAQQQNLEKQNQELVRLRDWLLPMLMNGQVTVA